MLSTDYRARKRGGTGKFIFKVIVLLLLISAGLYYAIWGIQKKEGVVQEEYSMGGWGEVPYQDGEKHGLIRSYHADGSLRSEENYVNGKREGEVREYYPNGRVAIVYHYKNDQLNGEVNFYFENGDLRDQKVYRENKLLDKDGNLFNGGYIDYYESGTIHYGCDYEDGVVVGQCKLFDEKSGFIKYFDYDLRELYSYE